jgi:hypothetical protein
MKNFSIFSVLLSLGFAGQLAAGGVRQAPLHASVAVRPAARLEVQSATAVTVRVTMYPNTQALVWTATGTCGVPNNAHVISMWGIHQLLFTPEEVAGKDRVCLTTSDGILTTSANLPQ